jgi:hypothetical protein
MGGGVDRGSNVDFQDFGVLVGFAMTQPTLDEVGVPKLIEKSPGSMEMKWRGSWPVWPVVRGGGYFWAGDFEIFVSIPTSCFLHCNQKL